MPGGNTPQGCTTPDYLLSMPLASSQEPKVCLGHVLHFGYSKETAQKSEGRSPSLLFVSELPSQGGGTLTVSSSFTSPTIQ